MGLFMYVVGPAVLIALFGVLLVRARTYMRLETKLLIGGCILAGLGLLSFVLAVTFSFGGVACAPPGCRPDFLRDVVAPILVFAAQALPLAGGVLVVLALARLARRLLTRDDG